ncbi:cytochrome P450 [Streptomyces sp. NPDC056144]|uniref:cytochrome P450 n=1 Tax=unclassified Streptomyces TaxID=2593676 RepID=UPI0035DB6B34
MSFIAAYDAVPDTEPTARVALLRRHLTGDRAAVFSELRALRPVFATPAGVFVTRYPDVLEVLQLPEVFTVGAHRPSLEAVLGSPFMLSRDGADVHWQERGFAQTVLRPADAPRVRELAARLGAAALDEVLAGARQRGESTIDLIQGYSAPVAARLAVEYLGFTGIDPMVLHDLSRRMQWAALVNPGQDPKVHADGVAAGKELHDLVAEVIARRRASGDRTDDVLGRMLRDAPVDAGFDDERVNANLVGFLIGSQQNYSQCVATALKELALQPGVLAEAERAAGEPDPAAFDGYVQEALRFHPYVPSTVRLSVRDHVLAAGTPRETVLPAGSVVHACLASAMFDEEVVADPGRFRVGRPAEHHLLLSRGAHDCVGRYSAEVALPELVRQVLLRPGLRPLPGRERDMDYAGTPYPQHYPVSTGPADPAEPADPAGSTGPTVRS